MKQKLTLIHDRCPVKNLPVAIQAEVDIRNLYAGENKLNLSFCGIMATGREITIIVPRGTTINNDEKYKISGNLLSALEKYSLSGKEHITTNDQNDFINEGISQLTLAKELLGDYRRYGLYTHKYKKNTINAGRPDWKKTIMAELPVTGYDGRPVYVEVHGSYQIISSSNIIAEIHADIVRHLDAGFGWWLTCDVTRFVAPELCTKPVLQISKPERLSLLTAELSKVYSDRDIRLLRNLIRYTELECGTENSIIISGVKKFQGPWEHMLKQTLMGIDKINSSLPCPVYRSSGKHPDIKISGMKTDIVLENEKLKITAVADAKYYDATTASTLPSITDLYKQYIYAKTLKLLRPSHNILNCLIFPGNNNCYSKVELAHQSILADAISDEFPSISCLYVDPMLVVNAYIHSDILWNLRTKILNEE